MITIVPYDASWPEAFDAVARPLRTVLGALALRIDHIGSTSVPGLAAKDIIDVQVTVEDFNCMPQLVGQLSSPMALRCPLVVANRTDASRNGVGGGCA